MATVKIILFESKTLKDDRHPVVLRVTHERKRRYFTLGEGNKSYSCTTEQWNEVTGRFRKNQSDYKVLNQILLGIEKSANEIILRYDLDKETFTFDRFERTFGRIKPIRAITFLPLTGSMPSSLSPFALSAVSSVCSMVEWNGL